MPMRPSTGLTPFAASRGHSRTVTAPEATVSTTKKMMNPALVRPNAGLRSIWVGRSAPTARARLQGAAVLPLVEGHLPEAPAVVPLGIAVAAGQLDHVAALHEVVVPARVGRADADAAV